MFCTYQKRPVRVQALILSNTPDSKNELIRVLNNYGYTSRETINGISFSNCSGFSFANWGDYVVQEVSSFIVYNSVDFSKTYEEPLALWLYVE